MSIKAQATKLPRLLSLLPKDGVGSLIYQSRWRGKSLPVPSPTDTVASASGACFYDVKKVHIRTNENGNLKGEAFGVLYWKGKRVTPEDQEYEPLKGSKYFWQAANPPLVLRQAAEKAAQSPSPPPPATEESA